MIKIDKNKKYLLAVSGGTDSIYLLSNILKILDNEKIIICHVNYNFRKDSIIDQKIVENFSKKYNLKLEILNVKEDYSNLKDNFESWARNIRYDFFSKVAEKYKVFDVLIAHNYNDLIETYILQKQRNNKVDFFGLKNITKIKNLNVIRPMLDIKKSEILNYLKNNDIEYSVDVTNFDEKYQRNKIRKKLNENDFDDILNEINIRNTKILSDKEIACNYIKNNYFNNELIIKPDIKNINIDVLERIVFSFFYNNKKENLIINKSNKIINEIAKRLQFSTKNFWKISFDKYWLFKDFNKLFFIEDNKINTYEIIVNNEKEIEKLKILNEYYFVFKKIILNDQKFPYTVTNDFENYKLNTFVSDKKTNRFFIDRKIRYKIKYLMPVIYNNKEKKILNTIKNNIII